MRTLNISQQNLLRQEAAISLVKETFERELKKYLSLTRVSSPIAILDNKGINDDLNGIERAVKFPVKALDDQIGAVVHSLAKWKRLRLKELEIAEGTGILTDMRALRPDEDYSPIHSVYVDQWDWEKHISPKARSLETLKMEVSLIYQALKNTEYELFKLLEITPVLPEKLTFIHSEELLRKYPSLKPRERDHEAAREYGAIFLMGIGGELSDGEPHDGRAPDYDDWSSLNEDGTIGLNGDLIVWNPILDQAFELSSMGIRVDGKSLREQLKIRKAEDRLSLYFHQLLLHDALPQSIGGGIGQSRVTMFLLRKRHIGEVQVGIWSDEIREQLKEEGIELL